MLRSKNGSHKINGSLIHLYQDIDVTIDAEIILFVLVIIHYALELRDDYGCLCG